MKKSVTVVEELATDSIEVTIRRNKAGELEYTGFIYKVYGDLSIDEVKNSLWPKILAAESMISALLKSPPAKPRDPDEKPDTTPGPE